MATFARIHSSRHEDVNKPFERGVDCSPPFARAIKLQARLLILLGVGMAAAFMWLVYNG